MPSTASVVSRRRVLAGGAAVAVLGMLTSGCGSPPPEPPRVDDLKSQSELARHDSELAIAAAAAAAPPMAAAFREVASERSRHAQALDTEIARVLGNSTTTSTETNSPTSTSSAMAAPAPSLSDVFNALRASADSARQLATTSSGYRAGLLGSIAAACTAAYTVALGSGEPTP